MYPEELCKPMRDELTSSGFQELKTAEEVDSLFQNNNGTFLIFINSVCGCAAGSARPGVIMSANNDKKPDIMATVWPRAAAVSEVLWTQKDNQTMQSEEESTNN